MGERSRREGKVQKQTVSHDPSDETFALFSIIPRSSIRLLSKDRSCPSSSRLTSSTFMSTSGLPSIDLSS